MNSGSFFRLDLEKSKVVDGITVFNYIDLPDLDAREDECRFPIRLTISSNHVSFIVHYYNSSFTPSHSEELILDLPFGGKDIEMLSSTIKHIYNTSFPVGRYLNILLEARYSGKNAKYDSIRNSRINLDSYSSLFIWELLDAKTFRINLKDPSGHITKFLRKLLLDFMFDLMHSDVFATSKYFGKMREGLMNDFFFSSIVKKSEYYYNRRLIKNRAKDILPDQTNLSELQHYIGKRKHLETLYRKKNRFEGKGWNLPIGLESIIWKQESIVENEEKGKFGTTKKTIDAIKKLYAEKLDASEEEWINVITGPLADRHFNFFPEWYEYEDEKVIKKKDKTVFHVSESWFVNPETELGRIVFPLEGEDEEKIHYINSLELCELLGTGDNTSVKARNTRVSRWFYRRFDFRDTFRLHFFRGWNGLSCIMLTMFFVLAITSYWIPDIWKSPICLATVPILMAAGMLIMSLVILIMQTWLEKRKRIKENARLDDILLFNRRAREWKQSVKLSVLFLLVGAFMLVFESADPWLVAGKFVCLLLLVLYFAQGFMNHRIDNIHLILPRLVASITTAWIMLVIGNELFEEHLSLPHCIIVVLVVFSFVLYENNRTLPKISPLSRMGRTLELLLISYFISLVVGVFAIDVLKPNYSVSKNYFDWHLGNLDWTLTINPDFLIPFSFLAMFIGVFIQMIFEEKNITEM